MVKKARQQEKQQDKANAKEAKVALKEEKEGLLLDTLEAEKQTMLLEKKIALERETQAAARHLSPAHAADGQGGQEGGERKGAEHEEEGGLRAGTVGLAVNHGRASPPLSLRRLRPRRRTDAG